LLEEFKLQQIREETELEESGKPTVPHSLSEDEDFYTPEQLTNPEYTNLMQKETRAEEETTEMEEETAGLRCVVCTQEPFYDAAVQPIISERNLKSCRMFRFS
jgi:hypothetical protein